MENSNLSGIDPNTSTKLWSSYPTQMSMLKQPSRKRKQIKAKTDCVDHERDNADQPTLENARTICVAPEVSNLFAALSKFISSHFLFLLSFSQRWTGLKRENSRNDRAFSVSFASCPLLLRVSLCLHKTWVGYSRPLPYKAFPKPHQQQQKRISVWCDQSCSAQKTILSLVHWKPQPRALLTP